MNRLSYIISVPLIAVTLGFVTPNIDLNHNIRETYRNQVIQQRQGTKKISENIQRSEHKTDRFKEWYKQRKDSKTKTDKKSEKLESSRTRRGYRDFRNQIRDIYNEMYGDQRRVAQFYVNSWFVASFSLDLDDNTLLRIKDVYAKAISEVGLAIKGSSPRDKLWKEKSESLKQIHSTFDRELKKTLDIEQYAKLKEMTNRNSRERNVDKGEI